MLIKESTYIDLNDYNIVITIILITINNVLFFKIKINILFVTLLIICRIVKKK